MTRYMIATSEQYLFSFYLPQNLRTPVCVIPRGRPASSFSFNAKKWIRLFGFEYRCNNLDQFILGLINRFQYAYTHTSEPLHEKYGYVETVFSTRKIYDYVGDYHFFTATLEPPPRQLIPYEEVPKIPPPKKRAKTEQSVYKHCMVISLGFEFVYLDDLSPAHSTGVISDAVVMCLERRFQIPHEICIYILSYVHNE